MMSMRIAGFTRICGKAQGYLGLPVRDRIVSCPVSGRVKSMTTAWQPTPDELALLNEGSSIYVEILGPDNPFPMMVGVGESPDAPNTEDGN
jgi:hypothetical protein